MIRTLLTEALALPDSDPANLAAELLASLDESTSDSQEDVDRLWTTEIERRANRVLFGDSHGEPWVDFLRVVDGTLQRVAQRKLPGSRIPGLDSASMLRRVPCLDSPIRSSA